jgi:hypothetical protein
MVGLIRQGNRYGRSAAAWGENPSLGQEGEKTMHLLHLARHWLDADPPGTNHLLLAVFAVAVIWIAFERAGLTARRFR